MSESLIIIYIIYISSARCARCAALFVKGFQQHHNDEAFRLQLANSRAGDSAQRRHVRPLDGGERQHRSGAELCVQGGRVWVLHLLEE